MIYGSPTSREISLTVRWLWGLSFWLSNNDSTVSTLSSVCTLRLPLPGRLSTVPNFTSSLWVLFFVQHLSKNSQTTERCNLYIHTDFRSKFCRLYRTASKLAHTASKLALILMSDLKDEKLIKKQTYKKTETCNLYSKDFCIFLLNIVKIGPENFELSRFKVGSFFETQCRSVWYVQTLAWSQLLNWCVYVVCGLLL